METVANRKKARWGIAASYVLAFACLVGAVYGTYLLATLLKEGKRADAVVVEVAVGIKGGKRAVLEFTTDTGKTVRSRDIFQMLIFRFDKGDHVTVWYHPADVSMVTIDLGPWTWQQPALLFLGFLFLGALGTWLPRIRPPGGTQ